MTFIKRLFTGLILLHSIAALAQGNVIFQENFDKYQSPVSLDKLGWHVSAQPGHSTYTVKDGKLLVRITPNKFDDGYAEIDIPVCRKGTIEFDVLIDSEQTGERGIGLTLDIYNISTFWHDYCNDWRLYFPEPVARRMNGFNMEPVGHKSIGPYKKYAWNHYRIYFDMDNDRVECYINDMIDPALIKNDAAVLGRAEYQGGKLRIGSMGICSGSYQAEIDNIVIHSLEHTAEIQTQAPRNLVLLFRGISFGSYRIGDALKSCGIKPEFIRNYDLICWRPSEIAENLFKYSNLPGQQSMNHAKTIVLIDAPCGPNNILPDFLLNDIASAVREGAKLVIFGGLFTLDKGEFAGTPLAEILPVEISKSAWQVKGSMQPLTIEPVDLRFSKIDWSAQPCVYYYHDLPLKQDASVLLRAGGKPLLVSKKYGKGEVVVFLGTVCGSATEQPPVFWKWKNWDKLVVEILNK